MPAPYETTGMKDTIAGYAGWFIENRVAPAAPYFVAFVLCLGLLGGAMAEVQAERGGFDVYELQSTPTPDWAMIRHQHTIAEVAIANADINHDLPAIYNPQTGEVRNA